VRLTFFDDQCVTRSIVDFLKASGNDVHILKDHVPVEVHRISVKE